MISANRLLKTRSRTEGYTFLKYADVPYGTNLVTVKVIAVRETPKLNSPCCLDIEPQILCDGKPVKTDKTTVPLNLTNMGKLAAKVGDDLSAARGMEVTFSFSTKPNPSARTPDEEEVMGLDLVDAVVPKAPAEKKK